VGPSAAVAVVDYLVLIRKRGLVLNMDDSQQAILQIRQLAHRLENSSNSMNTERVEALQELQNVAKISPQLVGEISLKRVLDFLREQVRDCLQPISIIMTLIVFTYNFQGDTEEYQEALDLIYRLIKTRDKEAAKINTSIGSSYPQ
jgi:NADH:ubiquinone oxidoreductase subunit C